MNFGKFFLKKILYSLIILIIVFVVGFISLKQLPGDVVDVLGVRSNESAKQKLRKELYLDLPVSQQLSFYLWDIITKFDFGRSYFHQRTPALKLFTQYFKITLKLSLGGIFLGTFIGCSGGIVAAFFYRTKADHVLNFFFVFLIILPTFVVAFLLQYLFGVQFRLVPLTGFVGLGQILPITTIALACAGPIFKITRLNIIEIFGQPYILTAYAKGLAKHQIFYKHVLKNVALPIISHVGLIFSNLLSGAIITEDIFNIKGIGYLLILSIQKRDNYVVVCCIIMIALCVLLVNVFTEVLFCFFNPKLKL